MINQKTAAFTSHQKLKKLVKHSINPLKLDWWQKKEKLSINVTIEITSKIIELSVYFDYIFL